jgi:lipid-binding SYLF domain-containing protein
MMEGHMRSTLAVLAVMVPFATMPARTPERAPRVVVPRTVVPGIASARDLHADVEETIARVKKTDPGLQKFFDNAIAYAVFPGITKGGIGIGAAHGDGELIEGGHASGTCSMTQVNVGLQLGGQQYSEIIFFQGQDALNSFKDGHFAFDAQASAVAIASGASANAKYRAGVVVFTQAKGGLMYEATIGGQKFGYKPKG